MDPPPAAGGDASEFLDVDVDHVARMVVFVADDLAQGLAGGRVEVAQPVQASADQDAMEGQAVKGGFYRVP